MQMRTLSLKEFNNLPQNTLFGLSIWTSQHMFQQAQEEVTRLLIIWHWESQDTTSAAFFWWSRLLKPAQNHWEANEAPLLNGGNSKECVATFNPPQWLVYTCCLYFLPFHPCHPFTNIWLRLCHPPWSRHLPVNELFLCWASLHLQHRCLPWSSDLQMLDIFWMSQWHLQLNTSHIKLMILHLFPYLLTRVNR